MGRSEKRQILDLIILTLQRLRDRDRTPAIAEMGFSDVEESSDEGTEGASDTMEETQSGTRYRINADRRAVVNKWLLIIIFYFYPLKSMLLIGRH